MALVKTIEKVVIHKLQYHIISVRNAIIRVHTMTKFSAAKTALLALNYSILFAVGVSKTWGLTQLTCTSNMTWWSGKSRWLSITGTSDIPVHRNFLVMVAAPFLRGSWRPTQDPELFQHVHKVPRKENSCISAVSIIAIHLHHVFPHSIICRKIIM